MVWGTVTLLPVFGCGNREDLTLPVGIYWNCVFGCAGGRVTAPRRLWPPEELAALSEGAGSSFTSGLIICAMTGWICLSCMILVMAWMKALGASTKAFASASGRSNTMAMSISPPSFLIRVGLPACIRSRMATALFSHRFRSHSSTARCASDPVCGGTVRAAGVPSAERNALSGNVAAGTAARAVTARRMSLSFTS